MKSSLPGIIITVIITFNLVCLAVYYMLKGIKDRRRLEEEDKEDNQENSKF